MSLLGAPTSLTSSAVCVLASVAILCSRSEIRSGRVKVSKAEGRP